MTFSHSIVNARSLGEAWVKSLSVVLSRGECVCDGPDNLLEFCNLYVKLQSIEENDAIIKKHADKERVDLMKLKYRSCEIVHNYKVSYGRLLYDNLGVNQIEWVIGRIRNKPETKSATIGLHHPGDDNLSCISLLDFKLRDSLLGMTAVYRSQNVFGSQPGNVLALREIQKYVAEQLDVKVGVFHLVVLSAHIYENDLGKAKEVVQEFSDIWSVDSCKE